MFGIQATQSNLDQFLIALYASLITGVITGLIVGIVGIVVWRFQAGVEKRQLTRQYQREFATFQEQIRFTLRQPQATNLASMIISPPLAIELVELLSNSPLALWKEQIPKQAKLITILDEFQQYHTQFTLATDNLLAPVSKIIRSHNNKLGRITDADNWGKIFYLGQLLEIEGRDILPWFGIGVIKDDQLPYFEELCRLLTADTEIIR
jgi:hypothetical protein